MPDKSTTAAATTSLASAERSRREMLGLAVVGGASAAFLATPGRAEAAQVKGRTAGATTYRLTVMGTTDTHGNVFNWDYFKDAEYTDSKSNDIGLAKAATLVKAVRAERGADSCLLLDAGDTIQGTPLSYYYAKVDPITGGAKHPMATAMNAMGYDAAALGNHEYNYGLETLRAFEEQCDFPLLSANSVDWDIGRPGLPAARDPQLQGPGRDQAGQGRHPRAGDPRRGHLGQGQRRGPGALRGHRGAGPRVGAAAEAGWVRRRDRLLPLGGHPGLLVW